MARSNWSPMHFNFEDWVDLDLFYDKVTFGLCVKYCFLMGKTVKKSLNGKNLLQMIKLAKRFMFLKKTNDPRGCLPLSQGYIHV